MSNPIRLGNVQLFSYPRGLQQIERQVSELKVFSSASTGSQVQLATPRLLCLTPSIFNSDLGELEVEDVEKEMETERIEESLKQESDLDTSQGQDDDGSHLLPPFTEGKTYVQNIHLLQGRSITITVLFMFLQKTVLV